jgi:hypothetical protein
MTLTQDGRTRLADEVLTFIEQREAEQIAYGVYDITLTGSEIILDFQASVDINLSSKDRSAAIAEALHQLAKDLQIIRFEEHESPEDWIFRSRITETVRLLTKLRQRIATNKHTHRISKSKRLIGDVKLNVASRRVPKRNISVTSCLDILTRGNLEQKQASDLLLTVINSNLKKLTTMSGFQERSLKKILSVIELDSQTGDDRGVVVTASTGAGKTYAFFLPVLAKIVLERCIRNHIGVKAICIYPRVALSENQLSDFIEVLYHLNNLLVKESLPPITVGLESGAAVYDIHDFQTSSPKEREKLEKQRGWIFNTQEEGYLSPFAYCVGTDGYSCAEKPQKLILKQIHRHLTCPECQKQYPFIKFARDVMEKEPPDLLIATTESLHRRLISSKYQYLFGTSEFSAPSVVMLDEIHLQTSTAGTQVSLLIRRLLGRIRLGQVQRNEQHNTAFIGLSATIAQPKNFLSELSGIPLTRIE